MKAVVPVPPSRTVGVVPGAMTRIARFVAVRYEIHHLLYAVLFVAAVEGTAAVVSHPDAAWRPSWATALRIVIVAVLLLYLRMVDEIKDLDYDRVHNPDRPLVTGAIGVGELWAAIGVVAVALTLASLLLSWWSAVLVVASMGYGLLLWALERASARVRDNLLLNLVVTYPVQLWIIAYLVVSAIDTGQVESGWGTATIALIFAGAFLHFEFARKTVAEPRPGEWYYSNVLGARGSAVAIGAFAVTAVAVDVLLVRPWAHPAPWALLLWIPVVLLALPVAGVRMFVSRASARRASPAAAAAESSPSLSAPAPPGLPAAARTSRAYPVVPAVVFVLLLYTALIIQALTWR